MKHIVIVIMLGFLTSTYAQTDFGIKAGPSFTFYKEDQLMFGEDPELEVGYFGGIFVDFTIGEGFHFQPELLYKGIGDFEFLNAPLYLKFDVDYNFSILAGPSLNYFFNFFNDKFKVRGDVNLAYNISDDMDINLKYTIGFEEISPNVLFLGLGYRL